jgi:hypothetical protein
MMDDAVADHPVEGNRDAGLTAKPLRALSSRRANLCANFVNSVSPRLTLRLRFLCTTMV